MYSNMCILSITHHGTQKKETVSCLESASFTHHLRFRRSSLTPNDLRSVFHQPDSQFHLPTAKTFSQPPHQAHTGQRWLQITKGLITANDYWWEINHFFAIKLKLGNHLPFRRCYSFLSDHVLFLRVWFPAPPSSSSQAPWISTPGNKTSTPNLMGNRTQPHTALYLSTPTQIHIKIKIRLKFIKRWFLNWLLAVRAKALNRKRTQTSLSRHWGQRKPEQGKKSFSTFFKSK